MKIIQQATNLRPYQAPPIQNADFRYDLNTKVILKKEQ